MRTNFLRRERAQDGFDLERQEPVVIEGQARSSLRPSALIHPALRNLLAGRTSWSARDQAPTADVSENSDGPKSPAPDRFHLPNIARTGTQEIPNQLPSGTTIEDDDVPSRVRPRSQRFPVLARPPVAQTNGGEPERHVRRSRFGGSNPAELHLVGIAEDGRRQQRARERQRLRQKAPPEKFLFCFPWVKSRRARALVLRCFVSGIFLISMLTVCMS